MPPLRATFNPQAIVLPQCCTKTEGRRNPCYVCLALIEAKVAMSFDLVKRGKQPFPIKQVLKDIEKLR